MNIGTLLSAKSLKPKQKTEMLSQALLEKNLSFSELIVESKKFRDPAKATCIEAIEFASRKNPELIGLDCLEFVTECLSNKAPRVKWESAKVIGNIAARFPENLENAIQNLLVNTSHEGTVVRWSAAFALAEIMKLKIKRYKNLPDQLESVCEKEEKNSIKKIYQSAFKKL